MDGNKLEHMSPYKDALGAKVVTWSPCGQFLAVGSYDQKVRIVNHLTWKTLAEHDHAVNR
jgi:hypothetical protein